VKYKTRPQIVEAAQFNFPPSEELRMFLSSNGMKYELEWDDVFEHHELNVWDVPDGYGSLLMREGYWLVKRGKNDFVLLTDNQFNERYYL
jgi:hypothetical protein